METLEFNQGTMAFSNGILYITYNKNVTLDETVFLNTIFHRRQITREETFFMLLDMREINDVTESGLLFAAENPCPENIKAIAVVTNKGESYVKAKLYELFDEPNIETKAFLSVNEAKNWFGELERNRNSHA